MNKRNQIYKCRGKNGIQQEDALRQQTGLKLGEELNEMLHLEHSLLQR